MADRPLESLLTPKEVALIFKCSLPLVYKWAQRGQLPCIRVDCPGEGEEKQRTMVRFKESDILNFLEEHYQ